MRAEFKSTKSHAIPFDNKFARVKWLNFGISYIENSGQTDEVTEITEINGTKLPKIEFINGLKSNDYDRINNRWKEMRQYLFWRLNNDNDYNFNSKI